MTPQDFVSAMKQDVRDTAESGADYMAAPPEGSRPPEHLARFSEWFRRLSSDDQEVARECMRYAAEGSLFSLLTILDNTADLTEEGGEFELWHVDEAGRRVRLNDPEGDLLTYLFNNLP